MKREYEIKRKMGRTYIEWLISKNNLEDHGWNVLANAVTVTALNRSTRLI